ncbi:MAG TPA: POTRA domain-containing protein [Candidatus Sulfotelmatobacter sp.]|jgi:outer membrane protein insertion porin family|nr:POTRA domain-containing protein [Candidatus Sulfotelmatobacter sp.]
MRIRRASFLLAGFLAFLISPVLHAQTATLREVRVDGAKHLTEAQIASLTGLTTGWQVGRKELQDAADALVRTGLFAKVSFKFETHNDNLVVTFHIEENPRLPVSYDNFPWYSDSELDEALRKELPFYDGHLPEAGQVVERAAAVLKAFVSARDPQVEVTHQVVLSPLSDGSEQQFTVEGPVPKIAKLEFSDSKLAEDRAVRAHLAEIVDHPYSRMTINIFLGEQIRPIYQQQGFLQAKIGPAEVRLSGDPNQQKLAEQIPVYVPCVPGSIYRWKGVEWKGNAAISSITLTNTMGLKTGDVANGQAIEGGWERVREEYGQRGYLEAKVTPVATYDDAAHTTSYEVTIVEGPVFHYGSLTISGMSLAGERKIQEAWSMRPGDLFDKRVFEDFVDRLNRHRETIFKELPVHYDDVGHFLQTDPAKGTVEVLLDFK